MVGRHDRGPDAIKAKGGWGELTLLPFNKVALHAGAGIDKPYYGDINDGDRSKNIGAFGNIYYNLTSNLIVAFEYLYLKTYYKNTFSGDDNRFHGSVIYTF